jgi:alkanesulfonate monooxygenase SsuD/methylene tetrahydromethanopterin reductase-like flavin-dependent oxidoreductase (luciferase family)
VAESDEQAWKEYEKHLFYFAKQLLKGLVVFPPGYTSVRSIATIHTALSKFLSNVETRKQVEEGSYAIVGSPETVKQKLLENGKKLGVGNLLGLFQLGTLPADLTKKNMQLFAREVMPALQAVEHAPLPAMAPAGTVSV